jgi:AraC-like DNA-binding protein
MDSRSSCRILNPSADLSRFVQYYWEVRGAPGADDSQVERLLPNGSVEIVFRLGGPILDSDLCAYVVGPHDRAVLARLRPTSHIFGITCRPGRAFPFLQAPVAILRNAVVPLDLLWSSRAQRLLEKLHDAKHTAERVQLVDRAFSRMLDRHSTGLDLRVDYAVHEIFRSNGLLRTRVLAERLAIPRRSLAKRFEKHVGIPPKRLSRIVRFHMVIKTLDEHGVTCWPSAVGNLDYHDQSHMIRDFNDFCGLPPSEYFAERHALSANFRIR